LHNFFVRFLEKVILFIGASIALEYDAVEAQELLSKRKNDAKNKIKSIKDELTFVDEQIDICEMSKARIISWMNVMGKL